MYLFFDTETTGLPRIWTAPVTDLENWPRMIQLAWVIYDAEYKETKRQEYIIQPEGFRIPLTASNVHGITTEIAYEKGEALYDVLKEFYADVEAAETLVAHNIAFDEKIVGAELIRMNLAYSELFDTNRVCTMKSTADYCKIRGKWGRYKWPSLTELHKHLFRRKFSNAHNALADVEACARCFFELKKRGVL